MREWRRRDATRLRSTSTAVAKCSEYRGRPEVIDHVLASYVLVTDELPDITTITPEGAGLPSIGEDPNAQRNEPGSDHAAVLATFTI